MVILWLGIANILLYAFMAITAQALTPPEYGLFASLFSIAALLNVAFSGLQATSASHLARLPSAERSQAVADARRPVAIMAFVLLALLVAASPAIDAFVHAGDLSAVVAAGAFAAALLPWAALLGAYQGSSRFREYSLLHIAHAALRLPALLVLFLGLGYGGLLWALAFLALPPLLWGLRAYGRSSQLAPGVAPVSAEPGLGAHHHLPLAVLVAVAVGFPTLGDVLLVRHVYDEQAAGLYAGVALCGRVIVFIAIAISSVLYPRFVSEDNGERRRLLRIGLGASVLLAAPALVAMWLAPEQVLTLVVGDHFVEGSVLLPLYAMASLFFALSTVYAFYALAVERVRYILVVIAACLAAQVLAPFAVSDELSRLVAVNLVVAVVLVSAGALVLSRGRHGAIGGA